MASLTITVIAAHQIRVVKALGKRQSLVDDEGDPRLATADEVKSFLISALKQMVFAQERLTVMKTAEGALTQIDPT